MTKKDSFYKALAVCFLSLMGSSALAFTVSLSFNPGKKLFLNIGRSSGHEEITRQALVGSVLILRSEQFKESFFTDPVEFLQLTDLEPKKLGTKGAVVKNPIIRGNFATDVPMLDSVKWPVNLLEMYGVLPNENWHTSTKTQNIHSLRRYITSNGVVDQLQSAQDACNGVQDSIINASIEAWRLWRKAFSELPYVDRKLMNQSLFLMGHVSHIIQDSFSEAHSLRALEAPFEVKDVCFYDPRSVAKGLKSGFDHGKSLFFRAVHLDDNIVEESNKESWKRFSKGEVCLHRTFDMRDGIWARADHAHQKVQETVVGRDENGASLLWREIDSLFVQDVYDKQLETPTKSIIEFGDLISFKKCKRNWLANSDEKFSCMKHSARLARVATMRYFVAMASAFSFKSQVNTEVQLEELLKNKLLYGNMGIQKYSLSKVMPEGILSCRDLSQDNGVLTF